MSELRMEPSSRPQRWMGHELAVDWAVMGRRSVFTGAVA